MGTAPSMPAKARLSTTCCINNSLSNMRVLLKPMQPLDQKRLLQCLLAGISSICYAQPPVLTTHAAECREDPSRAQHGP